MAGWLERIDRRGNSVVLIAGTDQLTYAELAQRVRTCVAALQRDTVEPGSLMRVVAEPNAEALVQFVANVEAGVVSVPINPKIGTAEDAYIDSVIAEAGALQVSRVASDPMFVLFTSGTTGSPKGVVITVGNVAHNLGALAQAWGWSSDDRLVHALPMFHVHGLILGWFGVLRTGGCLHHVGRFDCDAIAGALSAAPQSSMLFAVPTMLKRLTDAAETQPKVADALRNARLLISGSAGLSVREHARLRAATGRGVLERYGLTETLINCAVRAAEGPRPGYVGPPLPGVELALVDDERRPVEASDDETMGEIAVRGPNVFAGYLNDAAATARVRDEDGWFYTGDVATRDADGAIRIVGRKATDLIKTGGFRVGAGEIEACLLEHPQVSEAAVVGVTDDDLGQRIEAHVVVAPGGEVHGEALMAWVGERLATHKRPRAVHFRKSLPRNALGKIQKMTL